MRTIVWGPPCSGKSTYVQKNAKEGDLICDYDAIYQAISGMPSKVRVKKLTRAMLDLVEKVYQTIELHPELDAWIITGARSNEKVQDLVKRFEAELVEIEISREEAHIRCDQDGRPAEWHEYIDRWFDANKKEGNKTMEKKSFKTTIEFKEDSDQSGVFQAIFSRFGDVDKQGDITLTGAFKEGAAVRIAAWGHNWGALPVGRGVIHQDEEKAWVDGEFFLDTTGGTETYKTVKNLGELQEWSYGFDVVKSSFGKLNDQQVRYLEGLDVFEVSPVLIGAGNNTQTTIIKSVPDKGTTEPEEEAETEAVNEDSNASGVDPEDMNLLHNILAMEANNEIE